MPTGLFHLASEYSLNLGFNPCSSGWCLPAVIKATADGHIDRFQSLFFWMMPTGFIQIKASNPPKDMFQSLFFWMMPTGTVSDYLPHEETLFQSLFFWMMPTGRFAFPVVSCGDFGFNPCSSGWCLPAHIYLLPNQVHLFVSILVLLDDAYRQNTLSSEKNNIFCFNPCSSGWCLPAPKCPDLRKHFGGFNPCSSGWCLPAATFHQPFD